MSFKASAQSGGGVETPGTYEFNVKDCFADKKYKGGIKKDSIKPNSIFKGQRIWRSISLENKQNKELLATNNKCVNIGFFEVIKFGLFEMKLNAFMSDDFNASEKNRLTEAELTGLLKIKDTITTVTFDASGNETTVIKIESRYLQNTDIKTYLLKEDWFINSYSGKLEKRIIAFAPLIYDKKSERIRPVFWLYYREWNELLNLFEARNIKDSKRISYAYALQNQYYFSRISKQSNIFGRSVKATYNSEASMESDVIQGKINNSESDLYED
ncbi:MAG: hypothetical protein H0W61_06090 [Bacteroidetes bacterium]|nr:hypothetical protein [Bacteroidota bacterium]